MATGRRAGTGGEHWEENDSFKNVEPPWRIKNLRREESMRTKRRSRFPVDSGALLGPSREFPGWDPKLWLIAALRDVFHLLG
jgi:hypothetical protein